CPLIWTAFLQFRKSNGKITEDAPRIAQKTPRSFQFYPDVGEPPLSGKARGPLQDSGYIPLVCQGSLNFCKATPIGGRPCGDRCPRGISSMESECSAHRFADCCKPRFL